MDIGSLILYAIILGIVYFVVLFALACITLTYHTLNGKIREWLNLPPSWSNYPDYTDPRMSLYIWRDGKILRHATPDEQSTQTYCNEWL